MKSKNNILMVFLFVFSASAANAQIMQGKIVYERKTNLHKKIKGDWVKDYIKEPDKIKTDYFELYFNDTMSAFKPQESELKEYYYWATSKNSVYQNFNNKKRFTIKKIWGEEVLLGDTLYSRQWKITDSKRNISGYSCRKAVWQANDTTRIYAWYCDEVMASVGPESFFGLPGAILGLASEDGGVIYFAKSVEATTPDVSLLSMKKSKAKIYAPADLKTKLEKEYGKEKWGKEMIKNTFGYW